MAAIWKFMSGFCNVGPPPSAIFQKQSKKDVTYDELVNHREKLIVICNDINEELNRVTKQFEKASVKCKTIKNGVEYINQTAFAKCALLHEQQEKLTKDYVDRKKMLDTMDSLIKQHNNAKDAITMNKILSDNQIVLNQYIDEIGGVGVVKANVEGAAAAMHQLDVITSMTTTPLGTPSTSSSIQLNVLTPDKEQRNRDLLAAIDRAAAKSGKDMVSAAYVLPPMPDVPRFQPAPEPARFTPLPSGPRPTSSSVLPQQLRRKGVEPIPST